MNIQAKKLNLLKKDWLQNLTGKSSSNNDSATNTDFQAENSTKFLPHLTSKKCSKKKVNRDARLRELRTSCLSRKFVNVWIHSTFGRISPSLSRKYYEHKIKKKYFFAWNEFWWTTRREWALNVRADLQYRYVVWNKIWRAWKEYIVLSKIKKRKYGLADTYSSRNLIRKSFGKLRVYCQYRQIKKTEYAEANNIYVKSLLRATFLSWRHQYETENQRHCIENTALAVRNTNLLKSTWKIWLENWQHRRHQNEVIRFAERYYCSILCRRVFARWLLFVDSSQIKSREKANADKLHWHMVKKCYFSKWCYRFEVQRRIADNLEAQAYSARRVQLHRYFIRWKQYVSLVMIKEEKINNAVLYYERKIKSKCFKKLNLHLVNSKLKKKKNDTALEFYCLKLKANSFYHWVKRMDLIEDTKLRPQYEVAEQHYNMNLYRFAFTQLQRYCIKRKHNQAQKSLADTHFHEQLVPKVFSALKYNITYQQNKAEMKETADGFRRENLLSRVFYDWKSKFETNRNYRLMKRMAILHYNESTTKTVFRVWNHRTMLSLQEKHNTVLAVNHYKNSLVSCVFFKWVDFIKEVKQSEKMEARAVDHFNKSSCKKSLQYWKKYVKVRCHKHKNRLKADQHFRIVHLRQYFINWTKYLKDCKKTSLTIFNKIEARNKFVLGILFSEWKLRTKHFKLKRLKLLDAEGFYQCALLTKIIKNWKSYVDAKLSKQEKNQELLSNALMFLSKRQKSSIFYNWLLKTKSSMTESRKNSLAISHYNNRTLKHSIASWVQFCTLQRHKKLLTEKGVWFNNARLLIKHFIVWRDQYHLMLEEHKQTERALWHWATVLQRKVLIGWTLYTLDRKRKKRRYNEALELHRSAFERSVIIEWAKVASDMASIRQKQAAARGAEKSYLVFEKVHQCVCQWKRFVAKKKASRILSSRALPSDSLDSHRFKPAETSRPFSHVLKPTISLNTYPSFSTRTRDTESRIKRPSPRKPTFLLASLQRENLISSDFNSMNDAGSSPSHFVPIRQEALPSPSFLHTSSQSPAQQTFSLPSHHSSDIESDATYTVTCKDRPLPTQVNDKIDSTPHITNKHSSVLAPHTHPVDKSEISLSPTHTDTTLVLVPPEAFLQPKITSDSEAVPLVKSVSDIDTGLTDLSDVSHLNPAVSESETDVKSSVAAVEPSFLNPADEILYIRQNLKHYKQLKTKHKETLELLQPLNRWIADQNVDDESQTEAQQELNNQVQQEIKKLKEEAEELREKIETKKPLIIKLIKKSQLLFPNKSLENVH